ncbi:MAG: hypothetical protein DRP56_00875 [Planctomycetota bacterium]|nr:MAG: hypothetical protein DRP56_00875 [Planctomycetota bacterium]
MLIFLVRQSTIAGSYKQKIDNLEKAVRGRLEALEGKAYGKNGEDGFVTTRALRQDQKSCQTHIEQKVADTNRAIAAMSKRLDRMDEKREDTREASDSRLSAIEISIAGLSSDIRHLTETVKRELNE